ncbi:hypothetical protein C8R47DRAFT_1197262 [Mycena vitilis]|nr:hypothetical protein C8R47DRAFT_1197262 [Mycena vitilis]
MIRPAIAGIGSCSSVQATRRSEWYRYTIKQRSATMGYVIARHENMPETPMESAIKVASAASRFANAHTCAHLHRIPYWNAWRPLEPRTTLLVLRTGPRRPMNPNNPNLQNWNELGSGTREHVRGSPESGKNEKVGLQWYWKCCNFFGKNQQNGIGQTTADRCQGRVNRSGEAYRKSRNRFLNLGQLFGHIRKGGYTRHPAQHDAAAQTSGSGRRERGASRRWLPYVADAGRTFEREEPQCDPVGRRARTKKVSQKLSQRETENRVNGEDDVFAA